MADNTDIRLRELVIYSVFVRNHTPEGTFRALIPDLPRIRALGADAVWLMPIHPIGEKNRKGTLGSPYANRDYRAVNPEYGTMKDFRALADAIRAQGMKCLIDVVYNHTSPDSVLRREHPEFFWRRPDGSPGNRVGDWTDIIDLDYSVPALWDYQIESLCRWAALVDGFRCDVASFVPVAFWKRAREARALPPALTGRVRPGGRAGRSIRGPSFRRDRDREQRPRRLPRQAGDLRVRPMINDRSSLTGGRLMCCASAG